ncbi:MAG: hypothetical protein AAF570_22640 [Bacteroidota bacterium]
MYAYIRLFLLFLTLSAGISVGQQAYGQSQVGQSIGSLVYIDGKNIVQHAQITMMRDELLSLECYDLQPNSEVHIKAVKGSKKVMEETITTNGRGAAKQILFFPKAKSKLKCSVRYTSKNGKKKKIDFQLKPV